jgi:hypothetical protein
MTLRPGFRLAVAPHFHLAIDWPERLALGAEVEQTAEGLVAGPPWRAPIAEELAALILDPAPPISCGELDLCLCLLVLPAHLRSAFWELLAQATEPGTLPFEGFNAFAAEIALFLAFKGLPVPDGVVLDLVVNRPGPVTHLGNADWWGLINLGEDAASVVFLNVQAGGVPIAACPPVRLQLEPGEGIRIPAGMLLGTGGVERDQPDVLLLIRLPGSGEAPEGQEPLGNENGS